MLQKTLLRLQELAVHLKRLPERQVILVLSLVVGLCSGLAAVLLKNTIHFVEWILRSWLRGGADSLLYIVYPGIGVLLSYLFVRYVVKEDIGHGITKILYAISRKQSKIKAHNMWTSIVASSMTIGFGGSVGAEAPIVHTGAAIGSNIAQFMKLNFRYITLLVGCGAAGAVAGIFKAPLAGVVFTIEILMFDLTAISIFPLLVSSLTATAVSYLLLGDAVTFSNSIEDFNFQNLPYYILLGVFCGFVSLYFTRVTLYIEGRLKKITKSFRRYLICAIGLGFLIFIFPPLYGEGYGALSALLNNNVEGAVGTDIYTTFQNKTWFVLIFWAAVMLVKVIAMSFTNSGGGVGGTFGPTLFIGGIAGFLVARIINISGIHEVHEANFALVGMAGTMAGVMQAPMTAIFLIAEITGGYSLLMPLMTTSAISFFTIRGFEKHSIYTKRLASKGDLITHDKDKAVLTLLNINSLIETDFTPVSADYNLGQLVDAISHSSRNLFPVLDENKHLKGILSLDDIRSIMFDTERYQNTYVYELMQSIPAVAHRKESMESVLNKFEKIGAWNLPVLDSDECYVGFVSKSKIFSAYRDMLQQFSYE